MSTPRIRSTGVNMTDVHIHKTSGADTSNPLSYPPTSFELLVSDTYSDFYVGKAVQRGYIEDVVNYDHTRPYQPCVHLRAEPDYLKTSIGVYHTYGNWNWTADLHMIVQHKLTKAACDAAVATIDFPSMLLTLGQNIRQNLDGDAMIYVTLAELTKTIRMIKNPFGVLRKDWRERAGMNPAAKLAKKGANLWLEHRYGWLSCYNDLRNYSKAWTRYNDQLARNERDLPATNTYRVRENLPIDTPKIVYDYHYGGGSLDTHTTSQTIGNGNSSKYHAVQVKAGALLAKVAVGCKAALRARQSYNALQGAMAAFGASSSSVFDSLWELVPYSFVVDWFVNTKAIRDLPSVLKLLGSADCTDIGYSILLIRPSQIKVIPSLHWAVYPYSVSPYLYGGWCDYGHLVSFSYGEPAARAYVRYQGLPGITLSQFFGTDLTWKQKASGAGLIIQRAIH